MHICAMDHPVQRLFAAIGDPSRFKVLSILVEGDYCVSEIAERVGLSQSCTTRHLQVLQREGIATRTRSGKKVIFRLAEGSPEMTRLLEWALIKRPGRSFVPAPRPHDDGAASRALSHATTVASPRMDTVPGDAGAPETPDSELEDFLL